LAGEEVGSSDEQAANGSLESRPGYDECSKGTSNGSEERRKKEGIMKNPTLLIMLPVHAGEYSDGPDVVLVDLTVEECHRLLARQTVARDMKSCDEPFCDMHFYYPARYYRVDKVPVFSEEEVNGLLRYNTRKNHLCRIIDAYEMKTSIASGEFLRDGDEERMEGSLVGMDETSFWWKAYPKHSDEQFASQFLDGKALDIFVRRYG